MSECKDNEIRVTRSGNPPCADNAFRITPTSCKIHSYVHEAFFVGGTAICIPCASDAVEKKTGSSQPWFFTGSPHGADILSAMQP